jgi:TusA-related sulfurtransferase
MTEPIYIQLNIFGQVCPSCLLMALKTLNLHSSDIRAGKAEIIVMTDDRQATTTIPAAVSTMGYLAEVTRQDKGYRIRIHGL